MHNPKSLGYNQFYFSQIKPSLALTSHAITAGINIIKFSTHFNIKHSYCDIIDLNLNHSIIHHKNKTHSI